MSCLWVLDPKLVILESLDVHVLLRSGQSQWMAKPEDNNKGTQRGIRGIHLCFSPIQKGTIFHLLDRLLSQGMRSVMKLLHPL
jgi:hypothetical protein